MKLLYPFLGVPSVFFPVGSSENGGTCEFVTERCLQECAVYKHLFSDKILNFKTKEAIYARIITQDPLKVSLELLNELKEADSNILCWFASGDCPTKDTEQIVQIARLLQMKGINQAMITRSHKLYRSVYQKRLHSFHTSIGLAFTIESTGEIDKNTGLFVLPDYEEGSIQFYTRKKGLSPIKRSKFYPPDSKEHPNNCINCLVNKVGCFTL
jgi:hypothetical protein